MHIKYAAVEIEKDLLALPPDRADRRACNSSCRLFEASPRHQRRGQCSSDDRASNDVWSNGTDNGLYFRKFWQSVCYFSRYIKESLVDEYWYYRRRGSFVL